MTAIVEIEKRDDLASLIPKDGIGVELGVAKGTFSNILLMCNPDFKKLYSIDRWAGDRGHNNMEYDVAKGLLRKHGKRSEIIRKPFEIAKDDFQYETLDFIYIDGYAHTGQDGGRTLHQWYRRLKPGGVFAGHDYHFRFPETVIEVNKFADKWGLELHLTKESGGIRSLVFPSWYVFKPTENGGKGIETPSQDSAV